MGVSEKRQNFHFGVEYPFKAEAGKIEMQPQQFQQSFSKWNLLLLA